MRIIDRYARMTALAVVAATAQCALADETSTPAEEIYTNVSVDVRPQFVGGDEAMYKWLSEHMTYPQAAVDAKAEGTVTVEFVVNSDGDITQVRVARGRHEALDAEAARVVQNMPKWTPGTIDGRPVSVLYYLPITFHINDAVAAQPTEDDVVVAPQFVGGEEAMYRWLSEHMVYPWAAVEDKVQGRVTVEFVVTKDGDITQVRVARGRHEALDAEAVRVVQSMPKWIPGTINGQPANVSFYLPITFRLGSGITQQHAVPANEVVPQFVGGDKAMYKWLAENIKVPSSLNINDYFEAEFTVRSDGRITDVKLLKAVHPAIDENIIRAIESMPLWAPGTCDGVPCDCVYHIRYGVGSNMDESTPERIKTPRGLDNDERHMEPLNRGQRTNVLVW